MAADYMSETKKGTGDEKRGQSPFSSLAPFFREGRAWAIASAQTALLLQSQIYPLPWMSSYVTVFACIIQSRREVC